MRNHICLIITQKALTVKGVPALKIQRQAGGDHGGILPSLLCAVSVSQLRAAKLGGFLLPACVAKYIRFAAAHMGNKRICPNHSSALHTTEQTEFFVPDFTLAAVIGDNDAVRGAYGGAAAAPDT
jgi:hypothetical protein